MKKQPIRIGEILVSGLLLLLAGIFLMVGATPEASADPVGELVCVFFGAIFIFIREYFKAKI